MRTTTTRSKLTLLFMAFAMLLALPAMAFADVVKNEVANGVGSEKTVTVGETTSIKYWIHKTGNTCDAAGATVYLKVSGQSGDVTFTQSQQFTGCDEENGKVFSFKANKAGTYTVEVDRVEDTTAGDGYSWGPAAFTLKAGEAAPPPPPPNDAPTVSSDAGDVFGNEGSTIQNSGSFSDANGDALTITKTGAGTLTQGANGSWSWSLGTTDNGSGSVTVTADDGKGGTVSDSFNWSASNVAPTATKSFDSSVNEGSAFNLALTSPSDPSAADRTAGFTYAFDCGDGNGYGTFSSTASASCATDDNGTRSVGAKIQDKDGGVSTYTDSVTISNLDPTISSVTNNGPVNEGSAATITVNATDPAGANDPLSYQFDCNNDNAFEKGPQTANSASCSFADNGTSTVNVRVTDGDGGSATDSTQVTVNNVAPTADLTAPNSANEGGSFNVSLGNVRDAGSADTHEYRFDCGDGSGYGAWGSASSASCAAGDGPGSLNVKGEVRDDDGGSNEYTASVTINNVAPTATKSFPSAVNEGTSFNLALTGATDVSSADRTAGFTYAFDCGNGYGTFSSSASAACPTTDDDTRSVGAKIRDKDGDVSEYTGSVTVNNVAPTLSTLTINDSSNGVACLAGNSVGLRFSFSDPGADTFNNSVIDWGDGTTNTAFNSSPVSETHSYSSPGTYTINVTVRDDDGGSDTESSAAGALSFAYKMSGILSPINSDGTSVFKSGSTIPVKVKITDCAGTSVGGLKPTIKTQLASSTSPELGINEPTSTSGADTGGILRYDALAGQYIYNMSSTSVGADQNAKYRVLVQEASSKFSSSQAHAAQLFGLRTK